MSSLHENAQIEQAMTAAASAVQHARADFPVLEQHVAGKPLVYLDSAATTQKPRAVLDCLLRYYERDNANVHRGIHSLSERATEAYEEARDKLRAFINARSREEIVFLRGTTEAINLVAQCYARPRLKAGDEILITTMEHHSNIVPWQLVTGQTGARLTVAPINDDGELLLDEFRALLGPRTVLVAVAHISNALGTINPLPEIIAAAHAQGIPVLVDGAQAAGHMAIDMQALDCDFYALSGHKMYAPTGIGALYGKRALLDNMPPYQGGGEMIRRVSFEHTEFNELPHRFEAGTPNIGGAIALGAAIDYLNTLGRDAVTRHEQALLAYGTQALMEVPGLRLIGTAQQKAGILSFVLEGVHAHDVSTILDHHAIAVRAGHHCAMPVMDRFDVAATTRASLALYNNREDIDALIRGLQEVKKIFR